MNYGYVYEKAEEMFGELVETRRLIHMHPETGFNEKKDSSFG